MNDANHAGSPDVRSATSPQDREPSTDELARTLRDRVEEASERRRQAADGGGAEDPGATAAKPGQTKMAGDPGRPEDASPEPAGADAHAGTGTQPARGDGGSGGDDTPARGPAR